MSKRKTILITLGSGGHTSQSILLIDRIDAIRKFNYVYLIQNDDCLSEKKIKIKGEIIRIKRTRGFGEAYSISFGRAFFQIFQIIILIKKVGEIDAVISTGPGIAIPVCCAGKLLRKKVIYIESWSRVHKLSEAGKILKRIADIFFVQWEANIKNNKNAKYAGLIS